MLCGKKLKNDSAVNYILLSLHNISSNISDIFITFIKNEVIIHLSLSLISLQFFYIGAFQRLLPDFNPDMEIPDSGILLPCNMLILYNLLHHKCRFL